MTKFVNLTDQEIRLIDKSGKEIKVPMSLNLQRGKFPCFDNMTVKAGYIDDSFHFEVKEKVQIRYLPEPREGVIYLVTGMISEAANRDDVLTASFTNGVKDKHNNIIASRSLVRYRTNLRSKSS